MNAVQKLKSLGEAAQYDLCGACGNQSTGRRASQTGRWIYPAALPDGREINLLKVLMTNACDNDCAYCVNRRSHDHRRMDFEPQELANLFTRLRERGYVQGLFLSSALSGEVRRTQDRMLAVLELLRFHYGFHGYIHVKVLPGADMAQVERATQLAQRVSVNLEAPGKRYLDRIAGGKSYDGLFRRMKWIKRFLDERPKRRGGQTTQFVVGASGESDRDLAGLAENLYDELKLRRVYYSAFQPVPDTPLESRPATPLVREHRLYQVDFLFRKYGFRLSDLTFDEGENLPLETDPKTLWARAHPDFYPVEVNRASRWELLRVPGIGPITVRRILKLRRESKIGSLKDLSKLGGVGKKAAPYVLFDGRTAREVSGQMALFR
jgi:putative DNA modification/repair radical SAM protein